MKDNEAFTRLELIKERMMSFFEASTETEAQSNLNEIDLWAKESGFAPIKKFCAKPKKKWVYLSGGFMCKITTGVSEGINISQYDRLNAGDNASLRPHEQ